jgi:protocatechuate 3,4-dioxygenase beta subunit
VRVKNSAGGRDDTIAKFMASPLPLGGTYVIVLHRKGSFAVSEPIEINETTPMRAIDLRFAEGIAVAGQIVAPDGRPVPGIRFDLTYSTPFSHSFGGTEMWSDQEGRFVLEHVNPDVPGEYSIELRNNPGCRPADVPFKPGVEPVTVRLERGRVVTGVVLDDATGKPVPGVEVYALPRDGTSPEPGGYLDADERTNERGEFRFTTMGQRQYQLAVRWARLAPPSSSTYVTGGQTQPVTLRVLLNKKR